MARPAYGYTHGRPYDPTCQRDATGKYPFARISHHFINTKVFMCIATYRKCLKDLKSDSENCADEHGAGGAGGFSARTGVELTDPLHLRKLMYLKRMKKMNTKL